MKERRYRTEREWSRQLENIRHALGRKATFRPAREGEGGIPLPSSAKEVRITWEGDLTPEEEALVRLLLTGEGAEPSPRESLARWLRRTAAGETVPVPPAAEGLFRQERVPYLVVQRRSDAGLDGVLQGYFEQEASIFPLGGRERLVLAPLTLLREEENDDPQSLWLEAGEGLVEAVASEAGEEVTVAVHLPVNGPAPLAEVTRSLRETHRIGRLFYPHRTVYAAWNLSGERLLASVDEGSASRYLAEISPVPFWEDGELVRTLEVFFAQNLNISETARRLYIHRNTLIYRLDRLREETGLDPRRLEDAFRIRLALLMARRLQGTEGGFGRGETP